MAIDRETEGTENVTNGWSCPLLSFRTHMALRQSAGQGTPIKAQAAPDSTLPTSPVHLLLLSSLAPTPFFLLISPVPVLKLGNRPPLLLLSASSRSP